MAIHRQLIDESTNYNMKTMVRWWDIYYVYIISNDSQKSLIIIWGKDKYNLQLSYILPPIWGKMKICNIYNNGAYDDDDDGNGDDVHQMSTRLYGVQQIMKARQSTVTMWILNDRFW